MLAMWHFCMAISPPGKKFCEGPLGAPFLKKGGGPHCPTKWGNVGHLVFFLKMEPVSLQNQLVQGQNIIFQYFI